MSFRAKIEVDLKFSFFSSMGEITNMCNGEAKNIFFNISILSIYIYFIIHLYKVVFQYLYSQEFFTSVKCSHVLKCH